MSRRPFEILLVEDNQADVELIREAFARGRIRAQLHIAKTGEEAFQFLYRTHSFTHAKSPDLILLDLNLPGMDGREVLERIKIHREFRLIPVLVLTSVQADLDILKSYAMGASCYILKPADPALFSEVIGQIQEFWLSLVQLPKHEIVENYKPVPTLPAPSFFPKRITKELVHVLYIEDSDADFEEVVQELNQLSAPQFSVHREVRLADSFEYLRHHAVDMVLLDLFLPDSERFETVTRFHKNFPQLALVVLTGAEDQALGIRAVEEGADDYLVKGQTQSNLLGRTLLYAIERKAQTLAQLALLESERIARFDAEKAAGIRDEFLSIASHELRNPLTSLKLQMSLLVKILQGDAVLESNDRVHKLAVGADREIDRFGKLIDTLLDFSKIQSGRIMLDYSRFEFTQVIRDTVDRLTPELKRANCEIILDLGLPIVGEWDLLRCEQLLINLLSNGIKYASGKPIRVSAASDRERVCLHITDQGPGIAPQDQERIFQRFERARIDRAVAGLGLGLYVVRQIIDTHGGTIRVKSELGVGSTFTVCLPLKPFGHGSLEKNAT